MAKAAPRRKASNETGKPRAREPADAPSASASLPPPSGHAVDETLWALADDALARAWREAIVLDRLVDRRMKAPPTPKWARAVDALAAQTLLVTQALSRAADLRGLVAGPPPGARVPFDPLRHELARGDALTGQPVSILAPSVERHGAAAPRAIVKAIVVPVRR